MFVLIKEHLKLSKENIISLFEDSKFRNFTITNVVIFDKDVIIDISINNPTLQARKKIESSITGLISQKFGEKINLKINTKIEKLVNDSNQIKGKPIPGINNIIAIASGKGGVGKSTVTSNIAVSLNSMGFSVGILDADIYGPSIPIMFDVENSRPLSVTIDGKNKMSPVESYGIKILSIGFFTKSDQAVIWRGPMAAKALNQMIFDAAWGNLDFLLIDLPPGTGDIHLSILQALPVTGSVIVSTPQNIALSDARKGVALFNQKNINVPVLGIIENMSYFTPEELPKNKYYIFGKDGAKNLAIDLDVPYLGELPIIQSIREASDYGHPASLQKESVISDLIEDITRNMVSELVKRNKNLPPSESLKITTMAGCPTVKK
ncbi:MAG: Mrp/NBP35 family ATP-binding protein [Flavobacteriaceae bacterium]|nr:Mrp/NBP35 family ATP-binding protein [Flavobacteriaceae bacterium]MBT4613823.1 Mrp/NBP35 family ATP-binding protein [Flavobacteriaceae bacterium]MBT5650816.1 Mrp/NBP35 family ATP-binding protein [Flavobacteriaceae bacterium]MBT7403829.1 Mrp/NBP35 family ATP-binding protein [Flavobacteriaceae bacterium]MBT7881431.1 Mrp/NBP35 family ATP-binding protein [Flavobacteriaceae bacterium]